MLKKLKKLLANEEGIATIEYVLLLVLVALGVFALLNWTGLKDALNTAIGNVIAALS